MIDNVQLAAFLQEDLSHGDVTSEALVDSTAAAIGIVHCRQPAVLAGLEEAAALASIMKLNSTLHAADGDQAVVDQPIIELEGSARAVLAVERTLLNLMSQLSGVATLTRRAVDAVTEAHTGSMAEAAPRVAATRKTIPGIRMLQKKAVVLGGGLPHRSDLGDAVLVKDNHLSLAQDVTEAVKKARAHVGSTSIEIEVESLADALAAAAAGADILLLDNMEPTQIIDIVEALRNEGLREAVQLEASGGITVDSVGRYADTGVDIISMGILTSSAPHIDFSLHFDI